VTKRNRLAFVLMLVLSIVTTMAILVPGVAQAAIVNPSVNWSGAAFEGGEPFYNNNQVTAYVEGSKAKVSFVFMNDTGSSIKALPYVDVDWGSRYYGAAVAIPNGQPATMYIEFDVPTVMAAGGLVEHGYGIGVEYQRDDANYLFGWAIGEQQTLVDPDSYQLNASNCPLVGGASAQFWVGSSISGPWTVLSSGYTLDPWTGRVDLVTAPAPGTILLANYAYYMKLGTGDGVTTVFFAPYPPIGEVVAGSMKVYLTDEVTKTVSAELASSTYTFGALTGEVKLVTPPTPNQRVFARYELREVHPGKYWSAFSGRTFVIYGQDQADAMTLDRRYIEIRATEDVDGWISASAQLLYSQAEAARAKGEIEYREGQFTAAKASLQIAVDRLNASIAAAIAFMTTAQEMQLASDNAALNLDVAQVAEIVAQNALIPKEGSYLDSQTAWNSAQTARINALIEAEKGALKAANSREKSYGTFVILIGVFLILVGAAVLLLAVGMFLKWRKPATGGST
jgi:hypothetical protein